MLRIYDLKIESKYGVEDLPRIIERRLHIKEKSVKSFFVIKESIDARKKPLIYKVYTADFDFTYKEEELLFLCKKYGLKAEISPKEEKIVFPTWDKDYRPVVVGFGPCGMFAALVLSMMGAKPIVLERGPQVEERINYVNELWKNGKLNENANCQFGEGGAGTFSDGKLTTGTKSVYQSYVLENFVNFGADKEILYKQKPHIGTDVLRDIVKNIRKEIISLGGEVHFNTKFEKLGIKNNQLSYIYTQDGQRIDTKALILALGHSSRDTIRYLYAEGIDMIPKNFSIGLRIEHSQDMIDKAQYGEVSSLLNLGPADYKLNTKTSSGRGVYTFCMCPGGVVVNASSQKDCITCNGMSYFKRDSKKANSAILCDVYTSDFEDVSPLAGLQFQEKYERLAFELAGKQYVLPKESYMEYKSNSILKACLPEFAYEAILEAIPIFGRKIKGFDRDDSMLYALESRSSSPVRIPRNEAGLASIAKKDINGLYPAGEGAGYAGGIMSAACDGIKVAVKLCNSK